MKNILLALFLILSAVITAGCSNSKESKNTVSQELKKENIEIDKKVTDQNADKKIPSSIESYMPENWKIKNTMIFAEDKMEYYSGLFGGKLKMIENNYIGTSRDSAWYQFQINVMQAADENEAQKIYDNLNAKTTVKDKYLRNKDIVYEFLANEKFIAKCRAIFKPE